MGPNRTKQSNWQNGTKLGQMEPIRTKRGKTLSKGANSDQIVSNGLNGVKRGQTGSNQVKPGQTGSNRVKPGQTGSNRVKQYVREKERF